MKSPNDGEGDSGKSKIPNFPPRHPGYKLPVLKKEEINFQSVSANSVLINKGVKGWQQAMLNSKDKTYSK